jgi:hypothetical protein
MGICKYCHQKAGWFTDAHEACVEKVNAGIESLKKCMADAVIEGKVYSDVSATIDKIAADNAIPQEQVHDAMKNGWSQGAEQRSKVQPISDQEGLAIIKLYLAAGLTEEEMNTKTAGTHALVYSNKIWTVLHDRIRPYPGPIVFNLHAGEVPVWGIANVWLKQQVTTTAFVGGYSGVSIRVANGLWYRLGGLRGHKEESTSLQELDCGEILLSNRAIYFSGRAEGGRGVNFRLPFNQIIRFKPYSDAVGICKNGAREQIFAPQYIVWSDSVTSGPEDIGYYLFNLLQALAAKDSGTKAPA